ncbi:shootin-1-like [Mytilus edulis]|uniref:shootin-1-like n=1 Tax=Mytilus edulis TaxID=6550 RepID=UPI0039EF38CC
MMATNDCANCRELKEIKAIARQVLKKYDELLEKYKQNEQQYDEVVKTLKEREAMLDDMKGLIEPAVSEHERLMVKYDIEVNCRNEAENIARKVTSQNITLKRQSQALLCHLEKIDITQIPEEILEEPEEEEETAGYKEYTDKLNNTIKDLEEKVSFYVTSLTTATEELSTERENNFRLQQKNEHLKQSLNQTENTLTQYQNAMTELSTMSESAYEEYEHLKSKYEIEAQQRTEAENKMQKIKAQNEAMKTQSTILMSKVANDQHLILALCKIEELEEDKTNLEKDVGDLKEQMSNETNEEALTQLEEEKDKLSIEIEDLTKKVSNYEQLYSNLERQYKELEKKLEEALSPPIPPPPPLPPPPSTSTSKGFLARIRGNKKKKPAPGQQAGVDEKGYGKALEEMMKRINSGKPILKENSRIIKEKPESKDGENPGAMLELHSVLNRFKNTQRKSGTLSSRPVNSIEPESELAKAFVLKKSKTKCGPQSSNPVNSVEPQSELAKAFRRVKWEDSQTNE